MNNHYRQCCRCVMDTSTRVILFDENGICNFCTEYYKAASAPELSIKQVSDAHLEQLLHKIKEKGKGKPYDCLLGISGGLDSSYLTILANDFGLRPLVTHFDNGWNTELSVINIKNIVSKLGFDLYTHVIDWEEFKDVQIAYFKSSVLDIEVPTDQLIFAILYKIAKEQGIKYILEGSNFKTEFIMPSDWNFHAKLDWTNLRNIHNKYGTIKLKKFPTINLNDIKIYKEIYDIQLVSIINFTQYNWHDVKKRLKEEFDYVFYQNKHYESRFTRFYQGYILPHKFGIDKRKAHLSTLICSGFITREAALDELKKDTYPIEMQIEDKEYVIKKWGLTEEEFDRIMSLPPVSHDVYGYDKESWWINPYIKLYYIYLYKIAYPIGIRKKPEYYR